MTNCDVVLISMPWISVSHPSLQLGILKAQLASENIACSTRNLSLKWLAFVAERTKTGPEFGLREYQEIASLSYSYGLGEWVFAECRGEYHERRYVDELRRRQVSESAIATAKRARQVAAEFVEECALEILEARPKCVGFSMVFSQTAASCALARVIKRLAPTIITVCGGASCQGTMGPALLRMSPWIDLVVQGEGERVVGPVMRAAIEQQSLAGLAGVCYREGDSVVVGVPPPPVNMDDVPCPDYGEYFEELQESPFAGALEAELVIPFETARGCWWGARSHCTFCGLNNDSMAFRSQSARVALSNIQTLSQKYSAWSLVAADNIMDYRYMKTLLPALRQAGHDIELFFEVKANMRRRDVELLHGAGVRAIQPGIESLSDKVLKLIRKGVTVLQNVALLKWCAAYNIRVNWNVLVGIPGADVSEYEEMAALAQYLVHYQAPSVSHLTIDRFSPYFDSPGLFALGDLRERFYYEHVFHAEAENLRDLAYTFESLRVSEGDTERRAASLLATVEYWRQHETRNAGALTLKAGPGWVEISDRRSNRPRRDYRLRGPEALVYLACDEPETLEGICRRAEMEGTPPNTVAVENFLERLRNEALVVRSGQRFLALAVPSSKRLRHLESLEPEK